MSHDIRTFLHIRTCHATQHSGQSSFQKTLDISMLNCPDLLAPEERGDGDEVAGEPADQEHHAAEEGGHQHPVRVVLTRAECRGGLIV